MSIQRISIRNILGVESLDIEPGTITQISGANGTGKSSVLEAIKSALGGGHDAQLIRSGSEKAEVCIVLDDATEIRKTMTAERSETVVKDSRFGKLARPAARLKELVDELVNPVDLLVANDKDRLRLFLEAMPMELPREVLEETVGKRWARDVSGALSKGHALERIEASGKTLFEMRTGVNREAKKLRSTIESIERDLPPAAELETDWEAEASELEQLRDGVRKALQERKAALQKDEGAKTRIAADAFAERRQTLMDQAAANIREIERKRDLEIAKLRDQRDAASDAAKYEAAALIEEAQAGTGPEVDDLTARLGEARAKAQTAAGHKGQRATLYKMVSEAQGLEESSTDLTATLARLQELREKLVSALPIAGLEVRNGEIYAADAQCEVRPWARLNTGQQIRISLEVAKLRAKDLKLILVDGFERIDPPAREEFKRQVIESEEAGWNYFVTVVSDAAALEIASASREAVRS